MSKELWLPKSETKVTVTSEGEVTVWDEMVMELKPVAKQSGFSQREDPLPRPAQPRT